MRWCGAEIQYLRNTYVVRELQNMTVQPFYSKGPHTLFTTRRYGGRAWKHNTSGVPNRINYCVALIAYTQFIYSGYRVETGAWP